MPSNAHRYAPACGVCPLPKQAEAWYTVGMETLTANIHGNTISATDELLRKYDGQTVTVYISPNRDEILNSQLDAIRTHSVSSWGEDAQEYVRRLRSFERVL